MATGQIKTIVGGGNNKVGFIKRTDVNVVPQYIFQIPRNLSDPAYVPAEGQNVKFCPGPGFTATGVALDVAGMLEIKNFSAIRNTDGSDSLGWQTTGATSAYIIWTKNDGTGGRYDIPAADLGSGATDVTAANIANAVGYTLIIADAAGNSLNANATP